MRSGAFDVVGERGRSEREDDVMSREKVHDLLAHRRKEPGKEGVILREAAAPRHRRYPHRGIMPFSEPHHVVPGAVAIDRRADHEGRTQRCVERLANRVEHPRLGSDPGAHNTRRDGLTGLLPIIGRNRNQHRSARWQHRRVIGACDGERNVLGARGLATPFHVRLWKLRGLGGKQERLIREDRACLLARGDDERRAVPVRGKDVAHCVTDAGGGMQIDEGGVVRRLRIAVRHAHDDRFLQAEHVAEVPGKISKQRQLRGAGIAEDRGHPKGAQQVQDGGADGHRDIGVLHEAKARACRFETALWAPGGSRPNCLAGIGQMSRRDTGGKAATLSNSST